METRAVRVVRDDVALMRERTIRSDVIGCPDQPGFRSADPIHAVATKLASNCGVEVFINVDAPCYITRVPTKLLEAARMTSLLFSNDRCVVPGLLLDLRPTVPVPVGLVVDN